MQPGKQLAAGAAEEIRVAVVRVDGRLDSLLLLKPLRHPRSPYDVFRHQTSRKRNSWGRSSRKDVTFTLLSFCNYPDRGRNSKSLRPPPDFLCLRLRFCV